jgi:Flp pilus assembly pilin Flp
MRKVEIMERVKLAIERLARETDGQDLLEYALLVALIVLVAIGAVATVGNTIYSVFWKSIEVAF